MIVFSLHFIFVPRKISIITSKDYIHQLIHFFKLDTDIG